MTGRPAQTRPASSGRPLLVTTDEELLDDVLRLAAAVGTELEVADGVAGRVAGGVAGGRSSPAAAPLVLVGSDVVDRCSADSLSRRQGVVILSRTEPTAEVWRWSVAAGAEQVLVLPAAEPVLAELLGAAGEPRPRSGRVVCCVGGRGGAGASVLAVALAVTAGRTSSPAPLLIDLDPVGGGLDLALGAESAAGLRWPDLTAMSGRVSAASLHGALPVVAGVSLVSMGRRGGADVSAEAAHAVVTAGRRHGDLVVVDLPRMLTQAAEAALMLADLTLLVVPAEVRACAAAAEVAARVAERTGRIELVVRGPAPSGLSASVVAGSLGLPLAGSLRGEPGLAAALDRGATPVRRGRGPLANLCRRLLAGLDDESAAPASARAVA